MEKDEGLRDNNIKHKNWIGLIVGILIGIMFLGLAVLVHIAGKDTTNFCSSYYKDRQKLDEIGVDCKTYGNEPCHLKSCVETAVEKKFSVTFDYPACYENQNPDAIRFTSDCGWMQKDYLILLGTVGLAVLGGTIIIISISNFFTIPDKKDLNTIEPFK